MILLLRVINRREDLGHLYLRILLADLFELALHAIEHSDIRRALRLGHPERRRITSIQPRDVTNFTDTVMHLGNVAKPGEPSTRPRERDSCFSESDSGWRAAEHSDCLFSAAELCPAAWRIEVQ